MRYTKEQRTKAISIDLYQYMFDHYPDCIIRDGNQSIKMRGKESVSIKKGLPGAKDWSCGKGYNNIDFMIEFYGMSPDQAIVALSEYDAVAVKNEYKDKDPIVRLSKIEHAPSNRNVFGYLTGRGIPYDVVKELVTEGLLFQDENDNAVFINKEQTRAELRGTNSFADKPFKGTRCTKSDEFWWFMGKGIDFDDPKPIPTYITEGAIDAISLYVLRNYESAFYVSMGGVSNQQIIDRIKQNARFRPILAVDNDDAGQACRDRNKALEAITPVNKDWNEDLKEEIGIGLR